MSNTNTIFLHGRRGVSTELVFWCIVFVCIVGLMILARFWQRGDARGADHSAVGRSLPVVSLDPLTGSDQTLTADELAGSVTLINFWGTWCPPCRREFPHLVELHSEFSADKNFRLVSISVPSGERTLEELRANTAEFLEQQNANFPTYFDAGQKTWRGVVETLDGKDGVPTTLVLSANGMIRGAWTGYVRGDENEMQQLLTELLNATATNHDAGGEVH